MSWDDYATEGASQEAGKKKRKKSVFWTVVMWISLLVFIVAAGYLALIAYSYWNDANRYQQISENVSVDPSSALGDMTADWEALRAINPEIVAWVFIPDTPINYPVCWSGDNEKYLKTNFDGANGVWTGAGTIFLDGENKPDFTDQNFVLYGHHMNDGSMFACLSDFAAEEVFEAHRTVYLLTPERNYQFKTFSLLRTTGSDNIVTVNFPDSVQMAQYVQDKENRSMVTPVGGFPDPVDVKQLLTLSTCDYNQYDGRAVLFSTLDQAAYPRNSAANVVGTTEGYVS